MSKIFASIALTNPKSPTNVGAVMRSAGCFAAQEVLYSGNRFDFARRFQTDTHSANQQIPLMRSEDFIAGKHPEATVVCIDLIEGAVPLAEFEHPENALYIFGPEDGSIAQDVINRADAAVYIPTLACLNLAQTVNLVLYDRATKLNLVARGDEQILQSRDRNNHTRAKSAND